LTVPVRSRGEKIYVPIVVVGGKSYRRGIFFLASAIKRRSYEKTLREKIFNEFYDSFFTLGHINIFTKEINEVVKKNYYLKHYRRFGFVS